MNEAIPGRELPVLKWEDVACPLCHARNEELVFPYTSEPDGHTFRLVRCRLCQMCYVNPRPDAHSIQWYYPEDYERYQTGDSTPSNKTSLWTRMRRHLLTRFRGYPDQGGPLWEHALALLLYPWLGPTKHSLRALPFSGKGKLLDYGCGGGWYAYQMKQLGWDVTGMDFSEHAARQGRERYGIPVHVGTIPHPAIEPESFDVINMGAVLEHVHSPHQVIEAASKALRPGGYLVVTVPNIASWTIKQFGKQCWHVDIPRHLLHFTPLTLRRLLNTHGLEVQTLTMPSRVGWMRRTCRMVLANPHLSRKQHCLARVIDFRFIREPLTRWTTWTKQGDALLALAYRPRRASLLRASA